MQPSVGSPFSSIETRWFFGGGDGDRATIKRWFEDYSPFEKATDIAPVEWAGRKNDEPDTYLLLPGYEDMGIKWREGKLQVKGLVADVGASAYSGRHSGHVQRWIKWTYAAVPAALRTLFSDDGADDRTLVPVYKTRAVRLVEIEASGEFAEVASSEWIRQGVAFEMTDLHLAGEEFYTIAFEAFPDTDCLRTHFDSVVGAFLQGLEGPRLDLARSMSYPAWLNGRLT